MGKKDFGGLESMVGLVGRLMQGETLTAATIAVSLGVKHAAGARRLTLLAGLPGARRVTLGKEQGVALERLVPRAPVPDVAVAGLCLVSSLSTALREAGMSEPVERLREELVRQSRRRDATDDLDRKFWFVVRGGEKALKVLPKGKIRLVDTIDAILDAKELTFDYVRFDGRRESLRVEPLTLAVHEHQLYVIGRPCGGGPPHPYRFARMANLRAGRSFAYPPHGEYHPRKLFQNVFGIFCGLDAPIEKVELRFAAHWGSFITSHSWHDTQDDRVLPDGRVAVTLQVRICHELRHWIIGFGSDVEVVGPAHLRTEIATRLARGAELYDDERDVEARPGPKKARPGTKDASRDRSRRVR